MTTNPAKEAARPPVGKLRIGLINAAIWQRATENGEFYTVSFERRYKDGTGKWQSTQSFGEDDLLQLSKLADQAHTAIAALRAGESE